jgi:hypothetical protein
LKSGLVYAPLLFHTIWETVAMHVLRTSASLVFFFLAALPFQAVAQDSGGSAAAEDPEALVRELYGLVTFPAETPPDWEKVRGVFLPQAVIILRTSRDSTTVFDVDGFVNDFVTFVENSPAKQAGFEEKILSMRSMVLGDIARVSVLYQAHIPGTQRPPQKGVDVFLLNKRNGRWWIASIVNEIPTPSRPIPEELQGTP